MMNRINRNLLSGCSFAALFAMTPAPASAQDATAAPPASAGAADAQNAGIDDIVVTANKREQNLNRVGSTVAAFSGEALLKQRIDNIADLAKITPGLTAAPSPTAIPVYTLRGVGFYEYSLAAYPDVSIYIDQVPLSLPIMSSLVAFDLERVEVLKGPQGTLFGNNATGGAINFIAAKPTDEFHAGVELSYGRFNTFQTEGYISGPISDTLRARLAVKAVNGDGWQRSYTRDDTLGKLDNIAGRFLLDWEATDKLKFSLNLNAWRDQNDPQAAQQIALTPQFPVGPIPILLYPNAPANARAADWSAVQKPRQDNKFKQATLRGDYELGALTVTSLTGISDTKFLNFTDWDGTSLAGTDVGPDRGHVKSFTQELRLSNGSADRFRWVVGANYERTTAYEAAVANFSQTTSAAALGVVQSFYTTDQRMRNYAGFANAEFDMTDQITLKAGVRQTKAKRTLAASNGDNADFFPLPVRPDGSPGFALTDAFNFAWFQIYGGVVPPIAPGGSILLDTRTNPDGTPLDPATYLKTGIVHNRLSEDNTSWSVGVDFKPSNDLLFYANVSKGYKAGSFPHLSGSLFTAYDAVTQESLLDFEAGFKAQLLDRKLSISGAAFYYDYRDKQLRAKFVDPIFGALDKLVNVPKSQIKGAELSVQARPLDGLTFSGSVTYLDAQVKTYQGIIGVAVDPVTHLRSPITASFDGVDLPYAPKLQYALRADYDFPLSSALGGFIGVGVSGQSKSIGILTLDPAERSLYEINARALVDGNIGINAADNQWRLSVWGKNIFNKYYWTSTVQPFDQVVRYAGRPAEYGVSLRFKI